MAIARKLTKLNSQESRKVSDGAISATKIVRSIDSGTVGIAEPDTFTNANSFGIATSATTASGQPLDVVTVGEFFDAFFAFPLNDTLYLGPVGTLTNIVPTTGFITVIGYSLGTGGIFLNIQQPIEII